MTSCATIGGALQVADRDKFVGVGQAELPKRQLHAARKGIARDDMDMGAAGGGIPPGSFLVVRRRQPVVKPDQSADGVISRFALFLPFFQPPDMLQRQSDAGLHFFAV